MDGATGAVASFANSSRKDLHIFLPVSSPSSYLW